MSRLLIFKYPLVDFLNESILSKIFVFRMSLLMLSVEIIAFLGLALFKNQFVLSLLLSLCNGFWVWLNTLVESILSFSLFILFDETLRKLFSSSSFTSFPWGESSALATLAPSFISAFLSLFSSVLLFLSFLSATTITWSANLIIF